jgi:hypothetical protein
MRYTTLVALAVILTGCATKAWVPGPNASPALTLEQQKAQCSMMARHGGTGFAAAGEPAFVAGAAVGHGVGNAVRAGADFNDCMLAAGYLKAE